MAEAHFDKLRLKDLKIAGFFIALVIYAFWSSPTPAHFTLPEILIALLLITATGLNSGFRALDIRIGTPWKTSAKLLLLYGLSLPVLTGLVMGNTITAMIRDIIPFLFLLLPLFLQPLFSGRDDQRKYLTLFTALLGLVFSLRVLWPPLTDTALLTDPFLLANAPTVLFAALLLMGRGGLSLYHSSRLFAVLKGVFFLGIAFIPLLTMALIMQRASIGIFCLAILFLLSIGLLRKPLKTLLPLLVLIAISALLWPVIINIEQTLSHKTELVGLNMRWQEAQAVLEALDGSFFTVLLGKGWGASFASPAVGGAIVNFTHSLITTYWLKTGLVGVSFVSFYLYKLTLLLLQISFKNPLIAVALGGPFLIDIFLYASFKSLDFGLILLLIPLWAESTAPLHKNTLYSIQKQSLITKE